MSKEVWKKVFGWPHEVSNLGRVRRTVATRGHATGTILKGSLSNGGYLTVSLCHEGKRRSTTIHRLVAEAFIPNPEQKSDVNHKNFDKQDNRPENLEWSTRAENMVHSYVEVNGPRDIFTKEQVAAIRVLSEAGFPSSLLAKGLGCCRGSIQKINSGDSYRFFNDA